MKFLLSFGSLFVAVILLQLSTSALGPLDALSGFVHGFTRTEIGLMGSAHFVGFFVGCWIAPRMIGQIGHVRAFAAFATIGTMGVLAHPLWIDPWAWAGMRTMSGFTVAGCYTIIEAWMQARVTNETRGRALGVYRGVDLGGSLVAQLLIGVLEPGAYLSYNIIAILACACVLPLTLSRSQPPNAPSAPRLRPLKAIRLSPLAAAGVVVAGVTMPAFRMVGPIFGQDVGLRADQIGTFLAIGILGGAVAQIPVGWLADKFDRRWVLIGLSVISAVVCGATVLNTNPGQTAVYLAAFAFGLVTMPVFSVATAHANDFAEPDFVVELSASLMFLYGVGAIAAPLIAASLMESYGPTALFAMIAAAHLLLAVFGLLRMLARPTATDRTAYAYTPRTSFILGKLLRRKSE